MASHSLKRRKRNGDTQQTALVILFLFYIVIIVYINCLKAFLMGDAYSRHLEYIVPSSNETQLRISSNGFSTNENDELPANCTPRAAEEMPENFFTRTQTDEGAIVVHILIALYMFATLAVVCDDYFAACIEVICEKLHLDDDIAGATFMAIGSSSPEFFTSVIGLFIAKSDIGVGAIMGSSSFNTLFIIGSLPLFAGTYVELSWYPITRDCLFYMLAVFVFVLTIFDGEVYWYDTVIMLVAYGLYIVVLIYNNKLREKAEAVVSAINTKCRSRKTEHPDESLDLEEDQPLTASEQNSSGKYGSIKEEEHHLENGSTVMETSFTTSIEVTTAPITEPVTEVHHSLWEFPDKRIAQIYWILMLPAKVVLYLTIPYCRKQENKNLYVLAFVMSLVWIAVCAYILVWMITIIGDAVGVPDTVMSIAILGIGTSVPDAINSISAARAGNFDMSVCNSLGTNIIDVLICLAVPWLIKIAVSDGEPVIINSQGLSYASMMLLSTIVFMMTACFLMKFRLGKRFAIACITAYICVITMASLLEMNVLGDIVLPPCPRKLID